MSILGVIIPYRDVWEHWVSKKWLFSLYLTMHGLLNIYSYQDEPQKCFILEPDILYNLSDFHLIHFRTVTISQSFKVVSHHYPEFSLPR